MRLHSVIFFCLFGIGWFTHAQNNIPTLPLLTTAEIIDVIAQNLEDTYDFSQLYDNLERMRQNPLNINTASASDLKKIVFLNEFQIENLISYRIEHGDLKSFYELQLVSEWNFRIIQCLLPFVYINSSSTIPPLPFKFLNARLVARSSRIIEKQKGYLSSQNQVIPYLGDPWEHQVKYKINSGKNLEAGFTIEKDRAEPYWVNNKEPDYYSAYIELRKFKCVEKLVVGDYNYKFGMGLALSSGFHFGKSNQVLKIPVNNETVSRYSSGEGLFFRGLATTIHLNKRLEWSCFASFKNIDATLNNDSLTLSDPVIESLSTTGYHRTSYEMQKRKNTKHYALGSNLTYFRNNWLMDFLVYQYGFNYYYLPSSLRTSMYAHQKHFGNLSLYSQWKSNKLRIYSEATVDRNLNKAIIVGIQMNLFEKLKMVSLYRNYGEDYYSFYSQAFSEGAHIQNEQGIYVGFELFPWKRWKFVFYADQWMFPKSTQRLAAPHSKGFEYYVQLDYSFNENTNINARYKQENKEGTTKQNQRFQFNHQINDKIILRTRLERNSLDNIHTHTRAHLIMQDLIWTPKLLRCKLYFRYAYIHAPNFDNRFYVYENDLLYTFRTAPYYGLATKFYCMTKFEISSQLHFWVKWSHVQFYDRDEISSSYEQINGNFRTEIRLQLQWKMNFTRPKTIKKLQS